MISRYIEQANFGVTQLLVQDKSIACDWSSLHLDKSEQLRELHLTGLIRDLKLADECGVSLPKLRNLHLKGQFSICVPTALLEKCPQLEFAIFKLRGNIHLFERIQRHQVPATKVLEVYCQ